MVKKEVFVDRSADSIQGSLIKIKQFNDHGTAPRKDRPRAFERERSHGGAQFPPSPQAFAASKGLLIFHQSPRQLDLVLLTFARYKASGQ